MRHYIPFHHVEGRASRQAHADLPEGTYEREMSKEGFFGPALTRPPGGPSGRDRCAHAPSI
jgi:homogentisate 1,2-dioxygenase